MAELFLYGLAYESAIRLGGCLNLSPSLKAGLISCPPSLKGGGGSGMDAQTLSLSPKKGNNGLLVGLSLNVLSLKPD